MAQLMKEVFRQPRPKQEPQVIGCHEYDAIVAECAAKGEKWTDPVFPPKAKSISPPDQWDEERDGTLTWVRATNLPSLSDAEGELVVFCEDPTPSDIQQGALGDCYFLSTLSCLAEVGPRVRKLIEGNGLISE